jgi:glucose-6-phosphate isomerase
MSLLDSSAFGAYRDVIAEALDVMAREKIVRRIWERDHTIWKPEPTEIANRLDWLIIMDQVKVNVHELRHEAREARNAGYTDVLLLGMGGSSLAPELYAKVFGPKSRGLKLSVLDSTDPGAVLAAEKRLNLAKTLFVVASKSGTTVEIHSFFKHFYSRTLDKFGAKKTGEHFAAITDKGSKLAQLSEQLGFRATFLNNPNIGGRYSALSFFGMYPAALVGVDIE